MGYGSGSGLRAALWTGTSASFVNLTPPSSSGATQVTFNISTTAVTSQKIVTVTARVSAGEKTGTFRINP